MSEDLPSLVEELFREAVCALPGAAATIANGHGSAKCFCGPKQLTRTLEQTGLWEKVTNTVQLATSDFTRLAIVDRATVTLDARAFRVVLIEADSTDGAILLHLRLEH